MIAGKSILLVSYELSRTGAPNSLLRQAGYLCEAGCRVTLWTIGGGPLEPEFAKLGIPVVRVGSGFGSVRRMARAQGGKFDLVICNTFRTHRYATAFVALGRPVVWFVREAASLEGPLSADAELAQALRTFYNLYTVSAYARDCLKAYNPHVRYFDNSVADRFREFAPLPAGTVRFGFLGSLTPHKGIKQLIAAYCSLPPATVKTSLRIAGRYEGTELGAALHSQTRSRPDVVWLGEVADGDRAGFFDSIDVLCMPSIDESCGLALLEGAMYGKALLATDRVGAKYVIGAGNGCVVPLGELKRGLQYFLDNAGALAEMQAESRRRYLALATPDREREAVLTMVEENLGNPPPPDTAEVHPVRQFFRKEDADPTRWRFLVWGVCVLECRKIAWLKRVARRLLTAIGVDPVRIGYTRES